MELKDFRTRLSKLREKKGVSASEMSRACGLSKSYINNIENDRSVPSLPVFFTICDYFDVTPGEFFNLDTEIPEKVSELHQLEKELNDEERDVLLAMARALIKASGKK